MKAIIMFVFAIGLIGVSSCTKCTVCTKPNATDVRVCEKDYDSNTAYGFAIDIYEAQNYSCKKSI